MIKISEFNPSISNKKESSTSANCKVIINNSPSTTSVETPTQTTPTQTSQTTPTLNNYVPEYTTSDNLMLRENDLFKHLAVSFSNILKSNNPKLIANLVDQSGKVILSANDLITAIALILGINDSSVKISYEDPEAGCLAKVNPIKKISSIKANGYDFQLAFNKEYNTLTDDFGVSLVSCLIGF
ncbi:MAG: hypothetical protein IJZ77_00605 [Bacilli bacterium]|nr:hypothetical protein [Bacilli bacterium]